MTPAARKDADAIDRIEIVEGVAGLAIYINDFRVAGPKPWGGGRTIKSFKAKRADISAALTCTDAA